MAAVLPGVPHVDELFPATTEEKVAFIARILGLPGPLSDYDLHTFLPGGWTNTVYRFSTPERRYTIREYGANTSAIIDRQKELENVKTIGMLQIYVTFKNGVIMTYQEGVPCDVAMLKVPEISNAIATTIAKFHRVTFGQQGPGVEMWRRLQNFIEGLSPNDPRSDYSWLLAKVAAKKAFIQEQFKDRPICLCHNDLTPANLLWEEETKSLGLIDYEYALWNWPEYDIANHFFEQVGLDFDIKLFPTIAEQKRFITTYLTVFNDAAPSDELVEEWRLRVELLVQMSGVFWGAWGHYQLQSLDEQTWPCQLYADYRMILSECHLPLPRPHALAQGKLLPTVE
jgi:thiamine kinase-like enzyme